MKEQRKHELILSLRGQKIINEKNEINHFYLRSFAKSELYEELKTCHHGRSPGEVLYMFIRDIENPPLCEHCKTNYVTFGAISCGWIQRFCSTKCSAESKSTKELRKQNLMDNYGVDHYSKTPEYKEKMKKTSLELYGTEHHFASKEVIKKREETNLKKYGVKSTGSLKEVIEKRLNTIKQKHKSTVRDPDRIGSSVMPMFNFDDYIGTEMIFYKWKCLECESEFEDHLMDGHKPKCPICFARYKGKSSPETEIENFLLSIDPNLEIVKNSRKIIAPKELDLYLPSKKLAIEFNGSFWHDELTGHDKLSHLLKTEACEKQGIRLLHIWDYDWKHKQHIIKSIIASALGIFEKRIYARNCEIRYISNKESQDFLFENHMQGRCASSIRLGLFYESELVQVVTFGKSRYDKKFDFELIRSASKLNHQIVGGLSKLISEFRKKNPKSTLISYCNRMLFSGKGYLSASFEFSHYSKPSYMYHKNGKIYSRFMFQKHKLKGILKEYDENLTEWENVRNNYYQRIWDCGNSVFVLKRA